MNRRTSLLAVVVLAATLYARTLGFGFSHLDDDELVLADLAFLSDPSALGHAFARPYFPGRGADHAYYRPLVTASFALDALGSGSNAAGYRLTNLLLHATVACLLLVLAGGVRLPEGVRLAAAAFVPVALVASSWRVLQGRADRVSFAKMVATGSPHSALAARNLGLAYQLAGEIAPARRAYARALAADPAEPLVHNNLAVLFMAEGKLDEAERELRAELARDPDTREARDNLERIARAGAGGVTR